MSVAGPTRNEARQSNCREGPVKITYRGRTEDRMRSSFIKLVCSCI